MAASVSVYKLIKSEEQLTKVAIAPLQGFRIESAKVKLFFTSISQRHEKVLTLIRRLV